jgi:hypothetical protein
MVLLFFTILGTNTMEGISTTKIALFRHSGLRPVRDTPLASSPEGSRVAAGIQVKCTGF